jgi:hypothetical protein
VSAGRGRREPTIPYQVSRRTSRPATRVLADIAGLEVPGTEVVARGTTHLVLAPGPTGWYGAGAAVTAGIAITLGVLIAAASSVALVALLPAALLPGVPLLLRHEARLAVGVVEDAEAGTVVTVGGDMWSALAVALHSYLAGLPPPETAGPVATPEPPEMETPPAVAPAATAPPPPATTSPDESAAS